MKSLRGTKQSSYYKECILCLLDRHAPLAMTGVLEPKNLLICLQYLIWYRLDADTISEICEFLFEYLDSHREDIDDDLPRALLCKVPQSLDLIGMIEDSEISVTVLEYLEILTRSECIDRREDTLSNTEHLGASTHEFPSEIIDRLIYRDKWCRIISQVRGNPSHICIS